MAGRVVRILITIALVSLPLRAVENASTGTYNETSPAGNIPSWSSGWPAGSGTYTGWNYVGTIGSEGGTYLGNGWVLTCAHVGAGPLVLNGVTYPAVANTTVSFTDVNNGQSSPADFILFQISPYPNLPVLPLRQTDPVPYSSSQQPGSPVAIIGYGDPSGQDNVETWGYNTVTFINQQVLRPESTSWYTNDFLTMTLTDSSGGHNYGNLYQVVSNDSGGADFIYNSTFTRWELAGINEVAGTASWGANGTPPTQQYSGFVQLAEYAAQINQIILPPTDTPTMPPWALVLMGGLLFCAAVPAVIFERR